MSRLYIIPGFIFGFLILGFFTFLVFLFTKMADNPFELLDTYTIHLIGFTFFQASLSTLFSVILGTLLAWSLSHLRDFCCRDFIVSLFSSSLVLPSIIVILGIITIFGTNGWLNSLLKIFGLNLGGFIYGLDGILFAHIFFNASYSASVLLNIFESIPIERYKLSKSLGLGTFKRFVYVEFPQIRGSLPGLSTVIFLLCFSSFAIVLILGGSPKYNTLEVAIYEALKFDFDLPKAIGLSFVQIFISLVALLSISRYKNDTEFKPKNYTLVSWIETKKERIFQALVILLFSILFLLPIVAIFYNGLESNYLKIFKESYFITSLKTSLIIALISSFFTITVTVFISFSKATIEINMKRKYLLKIFSKTLTLSTSIYLTIPPMVLGVGFFILSRYFPLKDISYLAIILANILLALPFAMNALYPSMEKVLKNYHKLTNSLDIKISSRVKYIYLPHLKGALFYIFAISFCFSLGDLSIIALFGDQDISTLPWYIYQKMGSYRSFDAAGGATVLLFIIITLFLLSQRVKNVRS